MSNIKYAFIFHELILLIKKHNFKKNHLVNNQNSEGKIYHGNNLDGILPSEFGHLTNLTDLTIMKNPGLTSTIPSSFSMLTNLRRFRLLYNGIEGPWNEGLLKDMDDLIDLDLDYNEFNISLPLEIAEVKSLQTLSLAGNKIYGEIPHAYNKLRRLSKSNVVQTQKYRAKRHLLQTTLIVSISNE